MNGALYGKKADIYSLGLMLWEMWYGGRVFEELGDPSRDTLFYKVKRGYRPYYPRDRKKAKPPETWRGVMETCWHSDPESRFTADQCHQRFTSWKEKTAFRHR